MNFNLRSATEMDADVISDVFTRSLRSLSFLPVLHTMAEIREFVGDVILKNCEVTVAEFEGRVVSFLAQDREEVRLLHTHPDFVCKGAGSFLIGNSQKHHTVLKLWCFQQNAGARRFYERHGFVADRFTSGEGNEEKLPDVLYCWRRQ